MAKFNPQKYANISRPYGHPGDSTLMFDANEQQYLDLKQIDRTSLIWMQVMRLGQMSTFDPKAGGKEMLIQFGSGANSIIEKKYIPHPRSQFYYGVLHLFDLMIVDIDKLPMPDKLILKRDWGVLQDVDESTRDAHKLASKLFRDCIRVLNDQYGGQESIVDEVDPRVAKRIVLEKLKSKEKKE